jgi:hypothetical protein
MSTELLAGRQNRDGGWAYARGASWTEPTVYSVLALTAAGDTDAAERGVRWLAGLQRADGGWPPRPGIDESSAITALVALLPPDMLGAERHSRSIRWLTQVTGEETTLIHRVREYLLGNPRSPDNEFPGWPWLPGTAAWVVPTSLAILALNKEQARKPSPELAARIEEGRRFLLIRMCKEGGWNHGSVRALGYESLPYPETTGLALAALRGVRSPKIDLAVKTARRFLADCRSADACNWLRLGLLAHGQLDAGYIRPTEMTCRTLAETSVDLLVTAAIERGDATFG